MYKTKKIISRDYYSLKEKYANPGYIKHGYNGSCQKCREKPLLHMNDTYITISIAANIN